MEALYIFAVRAVLLKERDSSEEVCLDLLVGFLEGTTGVVRKEGRDTLCDIGNPEVRLTALTIKVVGKAEEVSHLEVRPSSQSQGFTTGS